MLCVRQNDFFWISILNMILCYQRKNIGFWIMSDFPQTYRVLRWRYRKIRQNLVTWFRQGELQTYIHVRMCYTGDKLSEHCNGSFSKVYHIHLNNIFQALSLFIHVGSVNDSFLYILAAFESTIQHDSALSLLDYVSVANSLDIAFSSGNIGTKTAEIMLFPSAILSLSCSDLRWWRGNACGQGFRGGWVALQLLPAC